MQSKTVLWIGVVVFVFIVNLLVRYIHTGVITNNHILESLGYTIAFSLVYFIVSKSRKE